MSPPAESKRDEAVLWDKCWIFTLASVVLLSLLTLGAWGRFRMLQDDNKALQHQLDREQREHEQVEAHLRKKLDHRSQMYNHLAKDMSRAVHRFESLNHTIKAEQANVRSAIEQAAQVEDLFLSECKGVNLPQGFEFSPDGQAMFPHDLVRNTTGLQQLLESDESLADLRDVTRRAERSDLFTQPTYPWLQWTWLRILSSRPELAGNFTEWGLARGGSSFFAAALARQHHGSLAGFDYWASSRVQPPRVLANLARHCGLSSQDARYYNLADPEISWPENGKKERLAFTHIDSNDYNTTLGILNVVYNNTVRGGLFTIDNFFHPSGGTKRAVEDFFRIRTPGKAPLLYPVFPGFSVVIFKDHFAGVENGNQKNALDGNFYSFDLIKGFPEVIAAVQQSLLSISAVYRHAKNDASVNHTARCWLAHAVQTARALRDFVASTPHAAGDYEFSDMFRFMAASALLTRDVA